MDMDDFGANASVFALDQPPGIHDGNTDSGEEPNIDLCNEEEGPEDRAPANKRPRTTANGKGKARNLKDWEIEHQIILLQVAIAQQYWLREVCAESKKMWQEKKTYNGTPLVIGAQPPPNNVAQFDQNLTDEINKCDEIMSKMKAKPLVAKYVVAKLHAALKERKGEWEQKKRNKPPIVRPHDGTRCERRPRAHMTCGSRLPSISSSDLRSARAGIWRRARDREQEEAAGGVRPVPPRTLRGGVLEGESG